MTTKVTCTDMRHCLVDGIRSSGNIEVIAESILRGDITMRLLNSVLRMVISWNASINIDLFKNQCPLMG